jgi:PhnB protein
MSTTTTKIQPYLFLGGRGDEAIAFYKTALNAETDMLMRYSESPEPPQMPMPPGWDKKIMHASLRIGSTGIFLSDGCGENESGYKGFSLSLSVPNEAEAKRAFAALSEGGEVGMPLAKTFFSPCFGMVTDKFGICWMVIVMA